MIDRRRWAAAYFAGQAAAVAGWWAAMAVSPAVRERFEIDPERPDLLDAYRPADLVVAVGGSALAAELLRRGRPAAPIVAAGVTGALAYATLELVGWRRSGFATDLSIAAMVAAVAGSATATSVGRAG